jgi:hypothetical protein
MKNAVFWDVAPCRSCVNKRFGGTYCPHPRSRIFLPWGWRRYVPPKRRFTPDPHGATSWKTAFFIVTAVKTSNLMNCCILDSRTLLILLSVGRCNCFRRGTWYMRCTRRIYVLFRICNWRSAAIGLHAVHASTQCVPFNNYKAVLVWLRRDI